MRLISSALALVSFLAPIAVFSMKVFDNKQAFIENAPIVKYASKYKWQKAFLDEIQNYSSGEKKYEIETTTVNNIVAHTNNLTFSGPVINLPHYGKHKFDNGHKFTFEFGLYVDGVKKSIAKHKQTIYSQGFDQWANVILNFNTKNIKKNSHVLIKLDQTYVNAPAWNAKLSFTPVGYYEFQNIVKQYIPNNVETYDINSVTLKTYFFSTKDTAGGLVEHITSHVRTSITKLDRASFNITTHFKKNESYAKKIYANYLYMSEYQLNNNKLDSNNLKLIIKLYEENQLINNPIWIKNPNINKNLRTIDGAFKFIRTNHIFSNIITFSIPIKITNFNYLLKAASSSSTKFNIDSNGHKKYWSTKPSTRIEINDEFVKSLKIIKAKNQLLVDSKSWITDPSKLKMIVDKINDFAINIFNKKKVKDFILTNNFSAIHLLHSPSYFLKIFRANKWDTSFDYEDYLLALKNSHITFKNQYQNSISLSINDIFNYKYDISDTNVAKSSKTRLLWNNALDSFELINSNSNFFISNHLGQKLSIEDGDLLQMYGLDLKLKNDARQIVHTYYYQSTSLDVSRDVSFVLSDGTVLDQDYKVLVSTTMRVGDYGYKQIRYKYKTLSSAEYIIVQKDPQGDWFSNKFNQKLKNLDTTHFQEEDIEYVFDQEINLIINPYSNVISSKINPEKIPKNIKVRPTKYKVSGTYKGSMPPSLPQGVAATVSSFVISGNALNTNHNLPLGVIAEPLLYQIYAFITNVEYDALPANIKNKFTLYSNKISGVYMGDAIQNIPGVKIEKFKYKVSGPSKIRWINDFGDKDPYWEVNYDKNRYAFVNFLSYKEGMESWDDYYNEPIRTMDYKYQYSEWITKIKSKFSGITTNTNWLPPSGVVALPHNYHINTKLPKSIYDALPANIKNKASLWMTKVSGTYQGLMPPSLPQGVNATPATYTISGTYKGSTPPSLPPGITATPTEWNLIAIGNNKPITMIDLAGRPRYGIKTVTDIYNGTPTILESWNDGYWSHALKNRLPIFDGVFGADMNGIQDGKGLLAQGHHKIVISLLTQNVLKKNKFNIYIDFEPVEINVSSQGKLTKTQIIKNNKYYDLYYSNEPINFKVADLDIAAAKSYILDSKGIWYEIPLSINSKLKDNVYYQFIDSTMNYVGFAKVIIEDRAGNQKIIFLKLDKSGDERPKLQIINNDLRDIINYQGKELYIFNDATSILLTDPLAYDIKLLRIQKDTNGNMQKIDVTSLITNYVFSPSSNYDYGKTIENNSSSKLAYVGDELKPFIKNLKSLRSWATNNSQINLVNNGFYELNYKTKLVQEANVTSYFYLNTKNQVDIYAQFNFQKEKSQSFALPQSKRDKSFINDIETNFLKTYINYHFPFEIKTIKIEYSLLWIAKFVVLPAPAFGKEGKYKITIVDYYGINHYKEFVLLDQSQNSNDRVANNMLKIYAKDHDQTTAFWKGKVIWWYYRYEDADHAVWEKKKFIAAAMKKGLTKEEAEIAYKHIKKDSHWDGDIKNLPGGFTLQELAKKTIDALMNKYGFVKGKNSYKRIESKNPLTDKATFNLKTKKTNSKIVITIGASVFAVLLSSFIFFLMWRRIKHKKIK